MEAPVKRIDNAHEPAAEMHATPMKKKRNPFLILGLVIGIVLLGVGG